MTSADHAWLGAAADLQDAFNEIAILKVAKSGCGMSIAVDGHTGFHAYVGGKCRGHWGHTAGRAIRAAYKWHSRNRDGRPGQP